MDDPGTLLRTAPGDKFRGDRINLFMQLIFIAKATLTRMNNVHKKPFNGR